MAAVLCACALVVVAVLVAAGDSRAAVHVTMNNSKRLDGNSYTNKYSAAVAVVPVLAREQPQARVEALHLYFTGPHILRDNPYAIEHRDTR
jgi:hypothetical protein